MLSAALTLASEPSKVMLAVPTYDKPDTSLTFALARSRQALSEAGIQSALLILEGNCHVDDARNSIVRDFLESDCTELVFLDADVTFEPKDLVQLCGRDVDIVGGVYPYRREGGQNMPVRLMEGGEVRIEVADSGPGFDPGHVQPTSLGLAGLRERIESLGGAFEVSSSAPGTIVRMSLSTEEIGLA